MKNTLPCIISLLVGACLLVDPTLAVALSQQRPGAVCGTNLSDQALAVRSVFEWYSRVQWGFRIRQRNRSTPDTLLTAPKFWRLARATVLLAFITGLGWSGPQPSRERIVPLVPHNWGPLVPWLNWGYGIPFVLAVLVLVTLAGYRVLGELSKHQYQDPAPRPRIVMTNEMISDLLQREHLLAPNPSAIEEFEPVINLLNDELQYRQHHRPVADSRILIDQEQPYDLDEYGLKPSAVSGAEHFLNVTDDLWILLQKNLPLADHYAAELKHLFPSGPQGTFRLAPVALRIRNSLMKEQPISASDLALLQELKRAAYTEPLEGLANLFLNYERTRPFGIELLSWLMRQRKTSLNRNFLDQLRAIAPTLAQSLDSNLARKPAPMADPQTLNELYEHNCPLRPSINLQILGHSLNHYEPESDPFSVIFWRTIFDLRDWLAQEGIPESRLVQALLAIERAKRRVTFHDRLERLQIPPYMEEVAVFWFSANPQRALTVRIDTELFASIMRDPHMDDILNVTVGHEFGHLADANGFIGLRPGFKEPQAPSRIQEWMAKHLVPNFRDDIVADLFAHALAGESAFQHDLLQLIGRGLGHEDEKLDALSDLNRFTYYLVLADSLHDREVAIEIRTRLESRCSQLIEEANLSTDTWQALREYYSQVLQSYEIKKKVILQPPSGPGANPTTPMGGSASQIGPRILFILQTIRNRAQIGSGRSAGNRRNRIST